MKSLSLFLFAAGASALFAVSCKNSSDDKLLNLKTVTFSFSGEAIPNNYEFVGDVKCIIDSSGETHTEPFTITHTDSTVTYVNHSNSCTLKIKSIKINDEDYTGELQYQFSSISPQLQTSSHTKSEAVKYSNSKAHKFFNLTLSNNIFTIVMSDFKQGDDINSTNIEINTKNTNNFKYKEIPLPENPVFSLYKTTITQDAPPTTRFTYKLSATNPDHYNKNHCKLVTDANLDTKQKVLNAYNSADAIPCPDLDKVTSLEKTQFPTYIILGSKAPDTTDDSFRVFKINQ